MAVRLIFLAICAIGLLCQRAPGADLETIDLAKQDWPRSALQREVWTLPQPVSPMGVKSVIYGFKALGYFELSKPRWDGQRLITEIFPPGYNHPIEYFVALKTGGEPIKLGQRKYKSPFAKLGQQPKALVQGHLSLPFVATSWAYNNQAQIPVVFNALGEMVWALKVTMSGTLLDGPVIKKVTPTEYVLMGQHRTSILAVIDGRTGEIKREFRAKDFFFHHDFQYFPESQEVAVLAHDCRTLPWWREFSPVFSGPMGWFNFFKLPRRSYDTSQIVKISLVTGKTNSIWSVYDNLNPQDHPNLALAHNMDQFIDIRDPSRYLEMMERPIYAKSRDGFECTMDWTHANSIRYYTGQGYLVSLRNLNRIVMINDSGKMEWSLGNDSDNTFVISDPKSRMGLQHDAWLVGTDQLMIFDNGSQYRAEFPHQHINRVVKYQMSNHEANPVWSKDLPPPYNPIRGSVDPLNNGNVFVHMSSTMSTVPIRYLEIDGTSKQIVGQVSLFTNLFNHPVAARPLDAIVDEHFLGDRPFAPKPPENKIGIIESQPPQQSSDREVY